MEDGEPLETLHWIFAPARDHRNRYRRTYEIPSLEVSGITWKQIQAGTPLQTSLNELNAFAERHRAEQLPVVAYNAPFDLAMYSDYLFLCGSYDPVAKRFNPVKPPLSGPWTCARLLAQQKLTLPDYKLDTVAAHFGESRSTKTHDALADAILAGRIFNLLSRPPM